jgi:hypothetical protein
MNGQGLMRKTKDEVNQVSGEAKLGQVTFTFGKARLERVAQCSAKPLLQCATSASVMMEQYLSGCALAALVSKEAGRR